MAKQSIRTVSGITYILERKAVKNLNLRVKNDQTVHVSAPPRVPLAQIDAFVASRSALIAAALAKFERLAQNRPAPREYITGEIIRIQGREYRLRVEQAARDAVCETDSEIILRTKNTADFEKRRRLFAKYTDEKCMQVFGEILREIYPVFEKMGVPEPTLRVREMKSRWGSCHVNRGIVTLNKRLLEGSRECTEYVIMHEMCHFIYADHSKRFYGLLGMVLPDWKVRRVQLENAGLL